MRASSSDLPVLIQASVSDDGRRLLDAAQTLARERSVPAYLVGGGVRDALLGHASPDLDITVESDAVTLAAEVAKRLSDVRLTTHDSFRTATLTLGDSHLDLITARREEYAEPGALPRVTPSSIHEDLSRRDFTINAMALGLTGPRTDALLDPFDGVTDLKAGVIRVLHDLSFQDDATRLLRAARYAARFRFRLEPETRRLADRDRGYLSTISPARIRNEFLRCYAEAEPTEALAAAARMKLPESLLDNLRFTPATIAAWRRLHRREWDEGLLQWLLPILRWDGAAIEAYIDRFALTGNEARTARSLPTVRATLARLARRDRRPSEIATHLDPLPPAAILAWLRIAPSSRRGMIAARYLDEFRAVRPQLSSAALKEMGVPEGPLFGTIVRALRSARLDDPSFTLDDERRLVQTLLG